MEAGSGTDVHMFLPVRDKAVHEEWARSCDIFEFHTDGVTSKDTVLTEASRLTRERDSRPLRGCVFLLLCDNLEIIFRRWPQSHPGQNSTRLWNKKSTSD